MSTTTQILFNSPALHSLKRDQLVKLCKIHSLKASGKKKELLERLQLHAKTLPPDDPLSVASRNDDPDAKPIADSEDEASDYSREGSPSKPHWETFMDTITEVDEETLRSNRGASGRPVDEFGTTTSTKASVTSSLRAIATSLGLKRNTLKSNDTTSASSSLSGMEIAQSSSTIPTSDPNGGPEELAVEPIPGQSNLQGLPAPSAGRLSLSQAPATTTIRLVSNPPTNSALLLSPPKLKEFATSFDLVPATPRDDGSPSVPVWPLSPGGAARESLYPPVPTFQGFGDLHKQQSPRYDNSDMDIDVDIPGGIVIPSICEPMPEEANPIARFNTGATPKSTEKPSAEPIDIFSPAPKPQKASTRSKLGIPRSEPFVFGSPLPQHSTSNLEFRTAAQSVLDEMNKRLAEVGVEAVDANVLDNRRTTTQVSAGKRESNGPSRVGDIFEKIHQKEFNKMDSITSHYAAKRGAQSNAPQPILSKKRKSNLVVKERQTGASAARHRVVSSTSAKILPGGLGEEDDEDDEVVDRRMSKRPRVEREEPDAPAQPDRTSSAPLPDPEEEAQKQKEREAIRRRLEHNKAKRRSSTGRPSVSGRAPPPKAKPARFGFFASAKSLVQNVWNRGAGSKAPSNIPVSRPPQPREETKTLSKGIEARKSATVPGSSGAPPLGSLKKRTPSGSSNASVQSNVPGRSILAAPVSGEGGGTATSTRTWRSPILSNNPPGPSSAITNARSSSTVTGYGQFNKRGSSAVGFSSLGRKTGVSADDARVSFVDAKSNIRPSATSVQKHVSGIPRSRTSSTLMAPTASSLAKINGHSRIPISAASQNDNSTLAKTTVPRFALSPQPGASLEQITNGPVHSPDPVKIFSQPFSPAPAAMSLTTAATSIVSQGKSTLSMKARASPKAKVLAGRKPRISRSKVIARLASQRAGSANASSSAKTERMGKVRSAISAGVAKKTRQSYSGARGGDMLMSAKKRVRQSEQARRRSRGIAGNGGRMDVD